MIKHLKFIIIVVILNLFFAICVSYLSHNIFEDVLSKNVNKFESIIEEFLIVVIFAPFLETLFLQVLTLKFFNYVTSDTNIKENNKNYLFIVLSSLLFAYLHQYNWLYVVGAFIGGLSFNYSYIYFRREKFYPYLSVVSIHLLHNLCIFSIKTLSK